MLPRRTLLAIGIVLDVALLARGAPLSARTLAERHDLVPRQFEALLQDLVRAGLLKSKRGPRGGYELARERRRISLGDIVRALDPDPAEERTAKPDASPSAGAIRTALARSTETFLAELDRQTLEGLCRAIEQSAARPAAAPDADFAI